MHNSFEDWTSLISERVVHRSLCSPGKLSLRKETQCQVNLHCLQSKNITHSRFEDVVSTRHDPIVVYFSVRLQRRAEVLCGKRSDIFVCLLISPRRLICASLQLCSTELVFQILYNLTCSRISGNAAVRVASY